MANEKIDCRGLVCPLPVAKVQQKARELQAGDNLEVVADCHSFCDDIKKWCEATGHPLISINTVGEVTTAIVKF